MLREKSWSCASFVHLCVIVHAPICWCDCKRRYFTCKEQMHIHASLCLWLPASSSCELKQNKLNSSRKLQFCPNLWAWKVLRMRTHAYGQKTRILKFIHVNEVIMQNCPSFGSVLDSHCFFLNWSDITEGFIMTTTVDSRFMGADRDKQTC